LPVAHAQQCVWRELGCICSLSDSPCRLDYYTQANQLHAA
jgi:hypothetical protein